MNLSPENIEHLKDVANQATALVIVDEKPVGAAFFISEDLLLTCGHVATQETVTIKPSGRPCRSADVIDMNDAADLALLSSHRVQGERPACVVLDQTPHHGDCFVAGFPREDDLDPGSEVFDVQAHPRRDLEGSDQVLEIDPGKIITWGMSGGPVVSVRSGGVIGIIRTSKDPVNALGGGATPISRAIGAFPQVAEILPMSTLAMVPWRDALGRDNWQELGKSWNIEECIDLRISGKKHRWLISLDQAAGPMRDLTGPDLGEEVSEAIFYWARRRHARGISEVALLGRLLGSALFPQDIANHLSSLMRADSIFVRLHVEHGNDLAEIPWELAAVPRERDRFLAAAQQFRFARVMDKPAIPTISAGPKSPADVKVLAAVAQPVGWKYPEIHRLYGGEPYVWPKATMMCKRLRASIERNGFKADVYESPQQHDVGLALDDSNRNGKPYDVLHYMGTGQRGPDGNAQIMFVDEDGEVSWDDAERLLETAAHTGVRIVVLELMQPPEGQDYEPLTQHALRDVVGGSVNAVVLTHLPVHPKQCQKFNDRFYELLGQGRSVETAVQLARYKLMYDKPMDDAAGFGWFTIVTGPQSGIRLVSLRPEDPMVSGVPHLATADRAVDSTGEPVAGRSR